MTDTPMLKALALYLSATARNQLRLGFEAAKSPRNLVLIVIVGAAIAYLFNKLPQAAIDKVFNGPAPHPYIFLLPMALELAIKFFLSSGVQCLGRSLNFKSAEIELLFSSPLSRRHIVLFKLLNIYSWLFSLTLFTAIISSLIFPQLSFIRLFIGSMVAITILLMGYFNIRYAISFIALHKLNFINRLIWLGMIGIIVYTAWLIFYQAHQLFKDLGRYPEVPAFEGLIQSVGWLVAPITADSWPLFFYSIWLPLLVAVTLCGLFFSRQFPYAFFEQNISGAGITEGQKSTAKTAKRLTPKLAAIGPQYRALFWKTVMASSGLRSREARWGLVVFMIGLPIICMMPLPMAVQYIIRVTLVTLIMSMVVISPWILRGGMRHDMPYLDLLKSMPIEGRQLMFGTMMVPVMIAFAIVAVATVSLGFISISLEDGQFVSNKGLISNFTMLPILFSLILARYTIHNLWAVHLPSFVSFDKTRGNDVFPVVLRVIISLFVAAVLLFIPVIVMNQIMSLTLDLGRDWLRFIGACLASVILVVESLALIYLSESRYQHFDISRENTKR